MEALLLKYALAVGLGALIGLERDTNLKDEKELEELSVKATQSRSKFSFIKSSTPAKNIGGLRTYILISTIGSLAGIGYISGVEQIFWLMSSAVVSFVVILFVLNYFDKNTFGLTTELSILLAYFCSVIIFATEVPLFITTLITTVAVLVLGMKYQLHDFVSKFSKYEFIDSTKFIIFTLVILPFLPNREFSPVDIPVLADTLNRYFPADLLDSLTIFNPFRIWTIVVLVMTLNYIGYFVTKSVRGTAGVNILAMLGGLVSSTAVTEAMALQSLKEKSRRAQDALIVATLLANAIQFLRTLFLAAALNFMFAGRIALPLVFMALFFVIWYFRLSRETYKTLDKGQDYLDLNIKSPFSIVPALAFGALFISVEFVSTLVLYWVGNSGFMVTSVIVAFTGLDAVTITASKFAGDIVSLEIATITMMVAICANMLVKIVFSMISGSKYFKMKILKLFVADIFIGVLVMIMIILVS